MSPRARASSIVLGVVTTAVVVGGCARAQTPTEPVRYFIQQGDPSSGFRPGDRELAQWALHAWTDQAEVPIVLEAVPEDQASLRIYWVRAEEGLYGEARTRMVEGRPVAEVYVRPDVAGLGPDIEAEAERDPLFRETIVYLTCVHEIGHAFGLAHTSAFTDIMYSFQFGGDFVGYFRRFRNRLDERSDIPGTTPLSDADRRAFLSLR